MSSNTNGGMSGARAAPAFSPTKSPKTCVSPRTERHARALAFPPSLSSPRNRDPDGLQGDTLNDRDIFDRFVSDQRTSAASQRTTYNSNSDSDGNNSSSTVLVRARPPYGCGDKGAESPRLAVPTSAYLQPPSRAARQSPSKARPLYILRPHSPVSDVAPETVVTLPMMQQLSPRGSPRKAILSAPDVDKINAWLFSLKQERRQSPSYFLYCEMLFRESSTLMKGKPTPNRLQTAIAFHCLCQASSIFGRHEAVWHRICSDLAAAIFTASASDTSWNEDIDALELYANQLTYYDQQRVLQQQRDDMERDLTVQISKNVERVKEDQLNHAKIQDLEARYKIKALEKISSRNTAHDDLHEKLQAVLQGFQYMDDDEKQRVVLGVVESLRAHLTAETLLVILDQIGSYEKEKLLRELFQSDIAQLTEQLRSEVLATSSVQQNAILERSAARITRFQTLIWDRLHSGSNSESDGNGTGTAAGAGSPTNPPLNDDDLCDQDRKVLESVSDMVDEVSALKKQNAILEQRLHDAEQAINNLRWKSNTQLNEAQESALQHAKEMSELRDEFAKEIVQKDTKAVQTESRKGGRGEDEDDDEDEDGGGGSRTTRGKGRRRRGGAGGGGDDEDDQLLLKNRRVNQNGFGIASLIDQAKIPSSKIRKILAKRKPLTLNELHAIIIGYYQAKMFQDIQDDNVGKLRTNLAQFIMDMYTLHYGLKDLAISQLVFLDASIRKFASESARVRVFGLLTGSLEPESHACSVQGIDFFLFVVVVIFNAGIYKRGRKQAVHVAQNLKTFFGEGIFMSPKSVTLKSDVICTTMDLIFSFTSNETGGKLDRLQDEIRLFCSARQAVTNIGGGGGAPGGGGGMEIDLAMEKIMTYWFMLYEQQIDDIHGMFTLVDQNGDGTLDFREFCEVVQTLEPEMDRREVLAIYNKAAGDDHVVDKDEFVNVMLAHQRGVILKEFYNGENNKKTLAGIQQRKESYNNTTTAVGATPATATTTPHQYKTLAGTVAHLDREESYASLVAAMDVVTDALQPLVNAPYSDTTSGGCDEEDEDEGGGENGGARMQDNVSFMTLTRLSLWASEAKDKMFRGVTANKPPPPQPPLLSSAGSGLPMIIEQAPQAVQPQSRLPTPPQIQPQQSQYSFEQDVNELLQQALSKANINIKDVF